MAPRVGRRHARSAYSTRNSARRLSIDDAVGGETIGALTGERVPRLERLTVEVVSLGVGERAMDVDAVLGAAARERCVAGVAVEGVAAEHDDPDSRDPAEVPDRVRD